MKNYSKKPHKRKKTLLSRNKSIIGDSIEVMMERLLNGEGIDSVEDRDLVYNDGETAEVNPITNIRSDKMELMLEEKIGEYEHKRNKLKVLEKTEEDQDNSQDPSNGTEE